MVGPYGCTVLVNTTRQTLTLVANNYVRGLANDVSERLMAQLGIHSVNTLVLSKSADV